MLKPNPSIDVRAHSRRGRHVVLQHGGMIGDHSGTLCGVIRDRDDPTASGERQTRASFLSPPFRNVSSILNSQPLSFLSRIRSCFVNREPDCTSLLHLIILFVGIMLVVSEE